MSTDPMMRFFSTAVWVATGMFIPVIYEAAQHGWYETIWEASVLMFLTGCGAYALRPNGR